MIIARHSDLVFTAVVEGNTISTEGYTYPVPVILTYDEVQDDRWEETLTTLRKQIANRYPLSLYALTALEDELGNDWLG